MNHQYNKLKVNGFFLTLIFSFLIIWTLEEINYADGAPVQSLMVRNESGERVHEIEVGKTLFFERYVDNSDPFGKPFQIELSVINEESGEKIFYKNYTEFIMANSKELIQWQTTPIKPGKYSTEITGPDVTNIGVSFEAIGHLTPLKQLKFDAEPEDVYCKDGLELIFKSTDGSPACVTKSTAQKLIERGWAKS